MYGFLKERRNEGRLDKRQREDAWAYERIRVNGMADLGNAAIDRTRE